MLHNMSDNSVVSTLKIKYPNNNNKINLATAFYHSHLFLLYVTCQLKFHMQMNFLGYPREH